MLLDAVLQITDEGFDSGPDDIHRLTVGAGPGEQTWNYSVVCVSVRADAKTTSHFRVTGHLGLMV